MQGQQDLSSQTKRRIKEGVGSDAAIVMSIDLLLECVFM